MRKSRERVQPGQKGVTETAKQFLLSLPSELLTLSNELLDLMQGLLGPCVNW